MIRDSGSIHEHPPETVRNKIELYGVSGIFYIL